ncbi:nucleotidyltransferase domain-containing protein [Jannaschia sp. S6380]|uniref:nucleotidyltransferase domain-containing protein n=1 Tax=Jannaschia sp. S6380 TaxID=2926408 RepID=UPI001FF3B663|nr:nucleotidyltransferase domain-containing protein [Jannaschia sp. S6380]MCK0166998.1 nucleotidyltransferase domain-containing protein [Jannaschia sp. S6380]
MRAKIAAEIDRIERTEDVRVLLAVESGSRAWGFHSTDSDYDVRFIYVRPVDWHLSLARKRDVIEEPIDDELDVPGWDLAKTIGLAMRSNAVVAEWLQSPIVYRADPVAVSDLESFCRAALSRRPVTWHYLSLMERQLSRLAGPAGGIRLKRYFYCLRPALALRWMRLRGEGMPPMDMSSLVAGCDLSREIAQATDMLAQRKKTISERGETGEPQPLIDALIVAERHAARDWLARTDETGARPDLLVRADEIHRRHVRAA